MQQFRIAAAASAVDAITNSSSELYVMPKAGRTAEAVKSLITAKLAELIQAGDRDAVAIFGRDAMASERVIVKDLAGDVVSDGYEDVLDEGKLRETMRDFISVQEQQGTVVIKNVEEVFFPEALSRFIMQDLGGLPFE